MSAQKTKRMEKEKKNIQRITQTKANKKVLNEWLCRDIESPEYLRMVFLWPMIGRDDGHFHEMQRSERRENKKKVSEKMKKWIVAVEWRKYNKNRFYLRKNESQRSWSPWRVNTRTKLQWNAWNFWRLSVDSSSTQNKMKNKSIFLVQSKWFIKTQITRGEVFSSSFSKRIKINEKSISALWTKAIGKCNPSALKFKSKTSRVKYKRKNETKAKDLARARSQIRGFISRFFCFIFWVKKIKVDVQNA